MPANPRTSSFPVELLFVNKKWPLTGPSFKRRKWWAVRKGD
jgi:hypothetical protein